MKLVTQTPKKALKAFLKQKPLRSEIDVFKTNLIALLDKISVIEKRPTDESEEHLKTTCVTFYVTLITVTPTPSTPKTRKTL